MSRLVCMIYLISLSLSVGQTNPGSPSNQKLAPANGWMKTPSRADQHSNSLPAVLRFDRDTYFDDSIGSPEPLTPDSATRSHLSEGVTYGEQPEIPPLSSTSAIITGRFDNYESVLSASKRSVYTEIHISVAQVIQHGAAANLSPQTDITIAIPGGTVDVGGGHVLSYLTDARQYALQPKPLYLLVLNHNINGDFYAVEKSWDLTSGVVKPNTPFEAERARKGTSTLVGLSSEAAISQVRRQLVRN